MTSFYITGLKLCLYLDFRLKYLPEYLPGNIYLEVLFTDFTIESMR